jgi:hypothetical protein
MKIASQVDYNFKDDRLKKESAREFVCQYLDAEHFDVVMQCAYDLNMTTEDSLAYAVAMFNAIQDIFYFHYNIKLGRISVNTVIKQDGYCTPVKDEKKIFSIRAKFTGKFIKSRIKSLPTILNYLKRECAKPDRMKGRGIKLKDEEKYNKKKEAARRKKRREDSRNQYKKLKKIKAKRRKAWDWIDYTK